MLWLFLWRPSELFECDDELKRSREDVVIAPLPAYGLYKHQTEILGGSFVPIPTFQENNFIPTAGDLKTVFDQVISLLVLKAQ